MATWNQNIQTALKQQTINLITVVKRKSSLVRGRITLEPVSSIKRQKPYLMAKKANPSQTPNKVVSQQQSISTDMKKPGPRF